LSNRFLNFFWIRVVDQCDYRNFKHLKALKPIDVAKDKEYKALFGDQASQTLSIYEHKHDHEHTDDGKIKQKN